MSTSDREQQAEQWEAEHPPKHLTAADLVAGVNPEIMPYSTDPLAEHWRHQADSIPGPQSWAGRIKATIDAEQLEVHGSPGSWAGRGSLPISEESAVAEGLEASGEHPYPALEVQAANRASVVSDALERQMTVRARWAGAVATYNDAYAEAFTAYRVDSDRAYELWRKAMGAAGAKYEAAVSDAKLTYDRAIAGLGNDG